MNRNGPRHMRGPQNNEHSTRVPIGPRSSIGAPSGAPVREQGSKQSSTYGR